MIVFLNTFLFFSILGVNIEALNEIMLKILSRLILLPTNDMVVFFLLFLLLMLITVAHENHLLLHDSFSFLQNRL